MQQKNLKQPNGNGKYEETNQPEKNQKKQQTVIFVVKNSQTSIMNSCKLSNQSSAKLAPVPNH